MLANVALDGAIGAVPVAGDVFDVLWRANKRNMRILREWIEREGVAKLVQPAPDSAAIPAAACRPRLRAYARDPNRQHHGDRHPCVVLAVRYHPGREGARIIRAQRLAARRDDVRSLDGQPLAIGMAPIAVKAASLGQACLGLGGCNREGRIRIKRATATMDLRFMGMMNVAGRACYQALRHKGTSRYHALLRAA